MDNERLPYPNAVYPNRVRPFDGDLVQVFIPGVPTSLSAYYSGGFRLPVNENGLVEVIPSRDVLGWCFGGPPYGIGSTEPIFSNPFYKP